MKKNIWMVLAAASLMTACDYNEKYFEGFDETDQSNVQKYTVEYTEKTFKENRKCQGCYYSMAHPEILYL